VLEKVGCCSIPFETSTKFTNTTHFSCITTETQGRKGRAIEAILSITRLQGGLRLVSKAILARKIIKCKNEPVVQVFVK
jgi:hypothetical protein